MVNEIIEEIKSLIVIGGLPTLGFLMGSITAKCCDLIDMKVAGIGGLVGGIIAIIFILRRIYKILESRLF